MKKLLTGTFLLLAVAGFAASNKMSMVTYFPVPYVAYSQVNAEQQLDIGLATTCDMNLGCSESGVNLKANQVNLKGGKLDLNGGKGISGDTLKLGNAPGSGAGKISFKNVRIQSGNMESLNAGQMNVKELQLFGKKFPVCKGKGKDGNPEGKMQWQKLTLSGATSEELYLVCGGTLASAAPEADCSDHTYKLAHKTECCPGTSYSDAECWRRNCSTTWVDGSTVGSVSGTSGYDNAGSPKGYCNPGVCHPSYSGNSVSGSYSSCISQSDAANLLEKVNLKKCSTSYTLGAACGAHQKDEHCYNSYEFQDTIGAPCLYYNIRITSGLKCQETCSYVKNY